MRRLKKGGFMSLYVSELSSLKNKILRKMIFYCSDLMLKIYFKRLSEATNKEEVELAFDNFYYYVMKREERRKRYRKEK